MQFSTWSELKSELDRMASDINSQGLIFRGVKYHGYRLTPLLQRFFLEKKIPVDEWIPRERASINFFMEKILETPTLPTPPTWDVLGWLSFMQHYDVPTRLTDWTTSPLVALFFAYNLNPSPLEDAALWCLNPEAFKEVFCLPSPNISDEDLLRDENELLKMVIKKQISLPLPFTKWNPKEKRIAHQEGKFVAMGVLGEHTLSIDDWLTEDAGALEKMIIVEQGNIPKSNRWMGPGRVFIDRQGRPITLLQQSDLFISKTLLPQSWKGEALDYLKSRGVEGQRLLPRSQKLEEIADKTITFMLAPEALVSHQAPIFE